MARRPSKQPDPLAPEDTKQPAGDSDRSRFGWDDLDQLVVPPPGERAVVPSADDLP